MKGAHRERKGLTCMPSRGKVCAFTLATSKPKRLVQNDKARNTIKSSSTAKLVPALLRLT